MNTCYVGCTPPAHPALTTPDGGATTTTLAHAALSTGGLAFTGADILHLAIGGVLLVGAGLCLRFVRTSK